MWSSKISANRRFFLAIIGEIAENVVMRRIALTIAARRDLAALSSETREAMIALIYAYAAGEAVDAVPMRNRPGEIRLKDESDHRAIVVRDRGSVTVLRIRHRNLIYRP